MTSDVFEMLAQSHAVGLADELNKALLEALATIDVNVLATVLDDTDASHIRQQLTLILDLDASGVPGTVALAIDRQRDRLASFVEAIAAHAAAQGHHTLNPGTAEVTKVRQAASSLLDRYSADTANALATAIESAIYGSGTHDARAHQLKRSLGLTVKQGDALEVMRTALQRYLDTPHAYVPAHNDAHGNRVRASYVRKANPAAILMPTRGHISAAQRKLLAKAMSGAALNDAKAEAILDKHANALRLYRTNAVAAEGIHELTEFAKLAGWRIAQDFGALPTTQRRYWRTAGDERVRHTHAQIPGMNPTGVSLSEPFATPLGPRMIPPLEYGCRCRAVLAGIR